MKLVLAILAMLFFGVEVHAQGCGPTNPNCIVPTAPPGTSDNRAASTAFVSGVAGVRLISVTSYGAAGNTFMYADGTITSGTNVFSSASATFTTADIGKRIVIDQAGSAGAPLITTIAGFTNSHTVTLAGNATTTVPFFFPWTLIPSTVQSGAGSYAPGDTINDGNFTAVVDQTEVASATINAAGAGGFNSSTGSSSGTCTVIGTTGAGDAKFQASVTITAGAVTAIGSITAPGAYTTNPTNLAIEPVNTIGACTGLTGASFTLKMGVSLVRPTTNGNYTSNPTTGGNLFCQAPNPTCSTSGSGTGATFSSQIITAGAFAYGTDDTSAVSNAITASNTFNSAGNNSCVYFPPGKYWISSPLPTWTSPGCVKGAGEYQSWLFASPSLSGDLLSWSETWNGTLRQFQANGGLANASTATLPGAQLSDITLAGDRTTTNTQNAIILYDRNDYVTFDRVNMQNFRGSCLAWGKLKNTGQGWVRESKFNGLRMINCGTTSNPALLMDSIGGGDGTNTIKLTEIDIFAPFGVGIMITNTGSSRTSLIQMSKIRLEGIQFDPVLIQKDLFVIGDPATQTATVNSISCIDCSFQSPYWGQFVLTIDSDKTADDAFNLEFIGQVSATVNNGNGIKINRGRAFRFQGNIVSVGPNVTLGSNAGLDLTFAAYGGAEGRFTYNSSGGTLSRSPMTYGVPGTTTQNFDVNRADSTSVLGNVLGNGSVNLQFDRNAATQVPSGTDSFTIGGSFSTASGVSCGVLGGSVGTCSGQNSIILGGARGNDRGRFGNLVHAGAAFGGGTIAQQTHTTIQCSTSSAAACTLTADANAAGAANCINIPSNSSWHVTVSLKASDITTPANYYSATWNASHVLSRGVAAATTLVDGGAGTVAPDSTRTVGALGGATIAADTTNGCLAVVYTPPGGNTDTIRVVADVMTVE